MRLVRKNQRTFWYALMQGAEKNEYGEEYPVYSDPVSMLGSIMPVSATEHTETSPAGMLIDYDINIIVEDPKCAIDEDTVLWVERSPTDGPYDCVVTRVSRALNHALYNVRRVTVT